VQHGTWALTSKRSVASAIAPRPMHGRATALVVVFAIAAVAACSADSEPSGPTPGSPTFDGEVAMELVRRQVAFGPRVPGMEGHADQLSWMLERLDSVAPVLVADTFEHVTTQGDSLTLVNVLARFRPEATRRILLLAHWDTRPTSDEAADPADRATPLPGANDGASGTAVLLALAPLLAETPPPLGVDLLFVDGEDYGPGVEDMLLGAKRYASMLDQQEGRPVYGVLLDMVGDADPSFPVEGHSAQHANVVVQKVWRAAERLGYEEVFPTRVGRALTDDHVPLIEAGLPTANVIDFTYGPGNAYWHTPQDVPENLSAETLGIVGSVVTELIYSGG
jgi:glutaminyl-peptide cyclotransferase